MPYNHSINETQTINQMKDKAYELFNKYYNIDEGMDFYMSYEAAKKCALIAVDEILALSWWSKEEHDEWQQVKQHIEQL